MSRHLKEKTEVYEYPAPYSFQAEFDMKIDGRGDIKSKKRLRENNDRTSTYEIRKSDYGDIIDFSTNSLGGVSFCFFHPINESKGILEGYGTNFYFESNSDARSAGWYF